MKLPELKIWVFFGILWSVTFVSAGLVDDIIDALEHAVDCASCHALLATLEVPALLGDTIFSDAFISVCKTLNVEDDDVCEGIIGQQGPIIAHDLRETSSLGQTATKICDALLGLCQPPDVNPFTVKFPRSAPLNPKNFTSQGRTPFQVVHFSDVHIDRQYTPGADSTCTKPICCRNYADHTGPIVTPAGPFGSRLCDTPTPLIQSMLHAIPATTTFSIFTGDVVEAAVWLVTQAEVTNDVNQFNQELATILGAPVYPAVGNHESAPANAFPRNTTSGVSNQWLFNAESSGWSKWLDSVALNQVTHSSGSYSRVVPGTNLRIISLNDIYWYKLNLWLYDDDDLQPDPNGILAFAVAQLQAAEDAGQRVWIIAHMPSGSGDALHDQSNYFNQIVQRYHNTIAGQFYGHSHMDQFAIGYSDYAHRSAATANSIGWIAPSITPREANSAFKVYDVDPDTYEIMDAKVFVSDLTDPTFQTNPTWKLYYSARSAYGPLAGLGVTQSLNPAFWHKVTEAFATNDTAFQMYRTFEKRGTGVTACDADCKAGVLCKLRALRAENNCIVSSPGLNFKKRAFIETHAGHCEGLHIGHILSAIRGPMTDSQRSALRNALEAVLPS
ncbi:hypothetical protein AMATHDRAFT_62842 [Amanita thiersii Skay4041]|uniref:Sphingomyelin phosphodiesterase n=1 Tax=Amanita thiersii Skay4041 TaxID=703135 RepID=A0A2A9NPJ4_9AGAR|nr:hypothetical protein AMATHDRAFT_62842 [Amanita thiersii Skay4041]